jgi:hypothetical protein
VQQLTLFDALETFDERMANWKQISSDVVYCHVLAYIPADALSPTEQHYTEPGDPEKDRKHQLWIEYARAIWMRSSKMDWLEAVKLLQKHRDEQTPCKMWIDRHSKFRPERVAEYL